MKKMLIFIGLTAMIGLSAQNLVRNPEFNGSDGWSPVTWSKVYGTMQVENNAMVLTNNSLEQYTMAQQGIKLSPETEYTISFRVKGENIVTNGKKGVGAFVMILNQGEFVFKGSPAGIWQGVSGSFDWKTCTLTFKTGKNIKGWSTLYLVLLNSTGKAFFSHLKLEEKKAAVAEKADPPSAQTRNLMRNPEFNGSDGWSPVTWSKVYGTMQVENNAMVLTNNSLEQYTMAQQGIKLSPETEYTISFRVKGENIVTNGKKGVGAFVMILNQGEFVFKGSPAGIWQGVSGSFDWKTCTLTFKTGKNIKGWSTLYLVLQHSTGKAFFSRISLTETAKTRPQTVSRAELLPVCWQQGICNLTEGMPGQLFACLYTAPRKNVEYTLELDLPPGVELCGASPWHWKKAAADGKDPITVSRTKKKSDCLTYRVKLSPEFTADLSPSSLVWSNYYRLYLQTRGAAQGGTAEFRFLADGKPLIPPQKLQIKVQPAPVFPETPLQKFRLMICYLHSASAPDAAIRNAYLQYWQKLAKRPATFLPFRFNEMTPDVRKTVSGNFELICFVAAKYTTPFGYFADWKKKNGIPVPPVVTADGRELEWACPSYAVRRGTPMWEDYTVQLLQKLLRHAPDARQIVWDFEPGAMNFCFCAECRKNFSESIGVKEVMTLSEIRRKHAAAWFQFRVKQNAEIIGNFAEICRRKFPGYTVALCTDPLHSTPPVVQEWCGVDVRMFDRGTFDLFMNMPYYQGVRWYDDLAFNQKQLKTPNFPLIDPSENMEMFYKRYTPDGVVMNMVAAAALGAKGIGFWPGDNFDGNYLRAVAAGCAMIAPYESYYAGGQCDSTVRVEPVNTFQFQVEDGGRKVRTTLPDFAPYLRFTVHKQGDSRLVTVFNYHSTETLLARISLPELTPNKGWQAGGKAGKLTDVNAAEGFLAEIPAGTVRQFEVTRNEIRTPVLLNAAELEKKLADFRSRSNAFGKFRNQQDGKAFAGWGVLPDSSSPMLKLAYGNRSIYLDPNRNGVISGCRIDDLEDILADTSRGFLDELKLYGFDGTLLFDVQDVKIIDGKPSVRMTAVVPASENADMDSVSPAGMQVEKTVSLENDGKTIRSVYILKNPADSARAVRSGFRLRNFPRLGASWNTGKALSSFWRIELDGTAGKFVFRNPANADNLILTSGAAVPGRLSGAVFPQRCSGGSARLCAEYDGQEMQMAMELLPRGESAGFLCWWGRNSASTLEPLTTEKILRPGESRTITSVINIP